MENGRFLCQIVVYAGLSDFLSKSYSCLYATFSKSLLETGKTEIGLKLNN